MRLTVTKRDGTTFVVDKEPGLEMLMGVGVDAATFAVEVNHIDPADERRVQVMRTSFACGQWAKFEVEA